MKTKTRDKILTIGLFSGIILIIIMAVIGILSIIHFPRQQFCDYDSCSINSHEWEYNGSACFDADNPECQDFLRLWRVCQQYKQFIGVC